MKISLPSLSNIALGGGNSGNNSSTGRPYSPGALDVLNADRARQGLAPIKASEDVKSRDLRNGDAA